MLNSTWAISLSLMLIMVSVLARWMDRDGSRPLIWHNFVWVGTLLLFGANLIEYDESSSTSWLILSSGLLAFNVASVLALAPPRNRFSTGRSESAVIQPLVSRSILFCTCVVYFAAFSIYMSNIAAYYGLEVLFTDPGSIRSVSLDGETYLSKTPQIARLGLNLGPVLLVIFAVRESVTNPLKPLTRAVMIVLIAASMLAMLQRTNLFMAILWYLTYMISKSHLKASAHQANRQDRKTKVLQSPARRRRGLVIATVTGPLVLLLTFQLMGSALGKTGQQALSTGRVTPMLASSGLSDIYVYATAGVPAFLKLADSDNDQWPPERIPGGQIIGDYNPQTFGSATFGPLVKFVPGAQAWNPIAPFMDVGILTNVFTWFELPYRDFRLAGVVVFGFVMGFLSTNMFIRRFRSARLYWIQAAFFSTLFLSIFVAKISTAIFWTGILYVALASLHASRADSATSSHDVSKS